MKALIIIMMVAVGFAGCNGFGGKSKEDELIVLIEMHKSLENAFNFIEMKNNSTENNFVEKLIDPNTSLKAQSIKPQFDSTISFSRKIIAYVDSFEKDLLLSQGIVNKNSILSDHSISLTREISINSEKVHQLFEKLKNYRVKLLSLDSNVFNEFNERSPKYEMDNFNHKMSLIEDLNLISKLKTDIVTSEGFLIDYYDKKSINHNLICGNFFPTVEVNALYFKQGQELVIRIKMDYHEVYHPTTKVGGVKLNFSNNGIAIYRTKVGKPGKYSKRVEIYFIRPDGTPLSLTKMINYEVADCPK